MAYIQTIDPEAAQSPLKEVYDEIKPQYFGMVPKIYQVWSLRPDLMQLQAEFSRKLMQEEHGLSRTTKELLAAYVSSLNVCEY